MLCSCSSKQVAPTPVVVVLPEHCETSEVAKFHRDEEILLVYKGGEASTENQKKDLKCMMLYSIRESIRRYQINGSEKAFGVTVFDVERFTIFRYFISPSSGIMSKEIVVPANEDKSLFIVNSFTFLASPEQIAGAIGTDGLVGLLAIMGSEGEITREQVFKVLNSYINSSPDEDAGPQNKKVDDTK